MTYEDLPAKPAHTAMRHYHGDTVRILFVCGAVLMLVSETFGASLPLSATGVIIFSVVLVIAAGITNPEQYWIHLINTALSILGALLFGPSAISHYRTGGSIADLSFLSVEVLSVLFLVTIYFAVKTVRGLSLRPKLL